MDASLTTQIIGYVGSALVILSLMQKSILRLRYIGLAGSVALFIYSILIDAYPIAIVNVIAAVIHIYFLSKLLGRPESIFSTLHVFPDSPYLLAFMDFHAKDIARFQPEFSYQPSEGQFAAFMLRDMVPAGLMIGRASGAGSVEILLDYAIPEYRDFKLGKFLYSGRSGIFENQNCDRAWATATTPEHGQYLERMGFEPRGGDRFEISLSEMQGRKR